MLRRFVISCWLLLAPLIAAAAPAGFAAWMDAAGPNHRASLTVKLQAGSADTGRAGQIFVAGQLADGRLFALTPTGWQAVTGTFPAAQAVASLGSHSVVLTQQQDLGGITGAAFWAGYGTDFNDMVSRGAYARVYTVGAPLAGASAAGEILTFSINVQDFSYPELSAATVGRIVDLHERYRLPVDIYLTDTMLDAYQTSHPALMARLTSSPWVGLNYHLRPPKPYYGTYDWAGITQEALATQVAAIKNYETHVTDPVTGQPSAKAGGYAQLLTLPNARPAITAAFTSSEGALVTATAQAFRELGASWSLSHVGGVLNLGDSTSGLFIRPEHYDLLLFQQTTTTASAAIEAALASARSAAGARWPLFVGVKMHDNDFFAEKSAWLTVYMDGSRRPTWNTAVKAALKSAGDQAAQWSLYEAALAHADAQRARLAVANSAGIAQLRAGPAAQLHVSGTMHIESSPINWPHVDGLIAFFRRAVEAGRVAGQASAMKWSIGADIGWLQGEARAGEVIRALAPLGVEFDVHTHEPSDRARAAERIAALGGTPTGVVSGFLYTEIDSMRNAQVSSTGLRWQADTLWGLVTTPSHAVGADDLAAGLWRPRSSADWRTHDPAGTLVAVGNGGRTLAAAEALVDAVASGSHVMPVYSVTINVAPKTLTVVGTSDGITQIEAWATRMGARAEVRWSTIAGTARAWRDAGGMASRVNP